MRHARGSPSANSLAPRAHRRCILRRMAFFKPRPPVSDPERDWVEVRLRWLVGQFGDGPLRSRIVVPTDGFFPGVYSGDADDVRHVTRYLDTNPRTYMKRGLRYLGKDTTKP
jgi:hypothetical protein